jgi:hypothetical protein
MAAAADGNLALHLATSRGHLQTSLQVSSLPHMNETTHSHHRHLTRAVGKIFVDPGRGSAPAGFGQAMTTFIGLNRQIFSAQSRIFCRPKSSFYSGRHGSTTASHQPCTSPRRRVATPHPRRLPNQQTLLLIIRFYMFAQLGC